MPAATTHLEFAKDVLRTDEEFAITIKNKQMFYIGSQGPDLLFFTGASILPGSLKKFGNQMHEEHVREVIDFFERYALGDADLMSYFAGYLCHYALDSIMHPLVYSVTAENLKKLSCSESEEHVRLEAEIDVWMLHQRGRIIQDYDVWNYLCLSDNDRLKLAKMYRQMFLEILHLDISLNRFYKGFKEIGIWTKVIRPRKNFYTFANHAENLIHNHTFTAMMLYNKKAGPIINLDHKSYTIPWEPHDTISASVPQLYGKALTRAHELLQNHSSANILLDFKGEPLDHN